MADLKDPIARESAGVIMRKFIGTKEVLAMPMNRLDYNAYRGWKLPEDENGKDEGYLVEYSGDNSNHWNHKGYISWSPKKEFDAAYLEPCDNPYFCHSEFPYSELPHEQRVIEEAGELYDKISKLSVFITETSFFRTLAIEERSRLEMQLLVMRQYYSVLINRIGGFSFFVPGSRVEFLEEKAEVSNNNFPRRNILKRMTPEELVIYEAIQKVEKMGAHPKLTNVITILGKAKDLLSDFVDNVPFLENLMSYELAENLMKQGNCISLPEWKGFWFYDMAKDKTMVLTEDDKLIDKSLETTRNWCKNVNKWRVVTPNDDQRKILQEYFAGEKQEMSFGDAIEALRQGKLITRKGWNGKGMFIVKQIPAVIGIDIIPKMQSLPQSAKDVLLERKQSINYENQMLIVNSNGRADSWVPSSSDCFATDWQILI